MHTLLRPLLARAVLALWLPLTLFAALLPGCGGGVDTGGTGTYGAGPITGFGSIIVTGIRFDDAAATVLDEDGVSRPRAELRLGTTVEVDAGATVDGADGPAATARLIRITTEIVGPVSAVDPAAGTLTVLGQTVRIGAETVFDERLPGALAGLAPGTMVAVHGRHDAAQGGVDATRIEPSTATEGRLRGPVTAIDLAARTLRIGGATFGFAGAAGAPPVVGEIVRLRLHPVAGGGGRYEVTAFAAGVRALPDRERARLRGSVTAFTSTAAFRVDGVPVDASAAAFPDGSAGLRLGARVEVEGSSSSGVLRATVVEVEDERDGDDEAHGHVYRLDGPIERTDPAAGTFVVRGVTVGTARSDLRLEGGTLADLQPGRRVDVQARIAADRSRLEATRIRLR